MGEPALDPVIHSLKRLEICAFLAPLQEAEFRVLREELGVAESVLSKHLGRLQSVGYVQLRKGTMDGRRLTWVSLTRGGRRAFAGHVEALRDLATRYQPHDAAVGEPGSP